MKLGRLLGSTITCIAAGGLMLGSASAEWSHKGERTIGFRAVGPGGLALEGKGRDVSLGERHESIVVTVGLADLKTGIGLRDKHMKEKYLEVAKYPRAVFTVAKSKVKSPGAGTVEGQLDLHGVTKPVKVQYESVGTEREATITGSARLNIKDFRIEVPSYLGVTVKPDITVYFKLDVVNK